MAHPDWNDSYTSGEPLPWDTGEPDRNLVEFWRTGRATARRVLEVGCGTGTNALWLARRGCDVLGVDVAPAAIERARQRAGPGCRFSVADFLRDEVSGSFDLVFDRGCFHVFDNDADRAKFASHVARVLAPGGRWLSLIGSTEGAPRPIGPPRRSVRDVVAAIEPVLRIVELREVSFAPDGIGDPLAWLCVGARRDMPAQPSTVHS